MDVFFVIASVFTVIIGTFISLILWKALRLLGKVEEAQRSIKSFTDKLKDRFNINKK